MSVRVDFSVMGFKLHVKWNVLYRSCFLVLGVRILSQNMNKQYLLVLSPRSPDKRFWSLHGFYWLFDWLIDWGFSPNRQDFSHVTTFVDIEMWPVFENADTSLAIPSKVWNPLKQTLRAEGVNCYPWHAHHLGSEAVLKWMDFEQWIFCSINTFWNQEIKK